MGIINKFPHYKNLTKCCDVHSFVPKSTTNSTPFDPETQRLFDVIFAPDSTGFPVPSPALVLQDGLPPEVRSFIREKLCIERPDGGSAPDADTAMKYIKVHDESLSSFTERCKGYVREYLKTLEPKNDKTLESKND